MSQLHKHLEFLLKANSWILRRKYLLISGAFVIYMSFFDQYKISTALSLYSDVEQMEQEKRRYEKDIAKLIEDKKDIENNYEKFAREKYYMSRQDEDVFIVE